MRRMVPSDIVLSPWLGCKRQADEGTSPPLLERIDSQRR
jgi:hypothetical protein